MGLDLGGVALAALDAVGIDGALSEEAVAVALAYLVPENAVELGADDRALFFGVDYTLELVEESVLTVDADKVHIKELCEGLLHKIALILAHETLIDEDAGELFADSLADERRRYGGIHASGEPEHNALVADLSADSRYGVVDEAVHAPVA